MTNKPSDPLTFPRQSLDRSLDRLLDCGSRIKALIECLATETGDRDPQLLWALISDLNAEAEQLSRATRAAVPKVLRMFPEDEKVIPHPDSFEYRMASRSKWPESGPPTTKFRKYSIVEETDEDNL